MPDKDPARKRERERLRREDSRVRDRLRETHRVWYERQTPEQRRTRRTRERYGLSAEDFEELKARHPVCAICKREVDYDLRIDHDHETGRVRGLLCQKCNLGLGYFNDDVETLAAAIDYLKEE